MIRFVSPLLIGAVFGLGIAVSGMANPAKVLNFFDIFGTWDPSLAFVMAGGLATAFVGYRVIFRLRRTPLLEPEFSLPTRRHIDRELVGGAAVFGIGWGIAGFCPGGAIPALGLPHVETPIFLVAMIVGIMIARSIRARRSPVPA